MNLTTKIFDKDGNTINFTIAKVYEYLNAKTGSFKYEIKDEQGKQLGYVGFVSELTSRAKRKLIISHLYNTSPNKEYKNVGTALHELVFRLSFLNLKANGNIEVSIGYKALLFHYHCGFRLYPKTKLEWDFLDKAAFAQWRSPDIINPPLPVKIDANEVIAFYYHLYTTNKDKKNRKCLRQQLGELGGLLGHLPAEIIAQKLKQFSMEEPLPSTSHTSNFFQTSSMGPPVSNAHSGNVINSKCN